MKVLFVTNGFPPRGRWGTEFYTWQLVGGLVSRGFEVAIMHPVRDSKSPRYTLGRCTAAVPPVDKNGHGPEVPVYLLHNAGDPQKGFEASYLDDEVAKRFDQVLEDEQPDLVHFTYLLWGLSVNLPSVAKLRGIPSVVTLTDYGLLCHRGQMYNSQLKRCEGPHPANVCARCIREPSRFDDPPGRLLLNRVLIRTAAALGGLGRVVTTNDLVAREAVVRSALEDVAHFIAPTRVFARIFQEWGIPQAKLTQLVYAFDHEPYLVAVPEPPRATPAEPIRFGYMGQFTPHKGIETLLKAIRICQARLPESVEPWRVHLYGRAAGGRHRMFADKLLGGDLEARIVVEEPFEPHEAPQILARLNAVIVPSEWDENAPLTILQARAAGVPVIGSDMEGIVEVVEPPKHGSIFPVHDERGLADAMREVILGQQKRRAGNAMPMDLNQHLDRVVEVYSAAATGGLKT